MWTVIIGGGRGCQEILELARGAFLRELTLDVVCVMDVNPDAPGLVYARKHGLKTSTDMDETLSIPDIELVIEATGQDSILKEIQKKLPPGAKLMDHTLLHVFWDLVNAQEIQKLQLNDLLELEHQLEKEKLSIQGLFDSIPDVVVVLDNEQRVIRTNARFTEYTGISGEEARGKKCNEVFRKSRMGGECDETCTFDLVKSAGKPRSKVHHTPPPKEAYWEVTQTPVLDKDGKVREIIETRHRITEMVMLRREIEQSEQRFREFINSASDLISMKDLEGRYMVVNKATARSMGLIESDFIGKHAEDVLPADTARVVTTHDREVLRTKKNMTFEEVFQIDGRDRHFHTTRFPLTNYKGDVVGLCTITRDITQRKQLQDKLVQSAKLVAVGQLAAGVAHEINNPLTGILAFAEDLLDEFEEGTDHQSDMQVIIRETLRCRDIVRNLLDFARQDAPKFGNVNLNTAVDDALALVQKLPRFRDIEIKKNIAKKIPLVEADLRQLQQVLLNLMLNAVDAMKGKGKIILTTLYHRRQDLCELSVEDTGPGIPENLVDKVFEPFFSSKGTSGLGLALSWGIVERHRGVIEVDTAKSGGAVFKILLPALAEWADEEDKKE
ncbi:MAG: PAS domain-containing sensor histidine kinase [Planctomycetota bacterium]|jgi:PAS domain S-box-containing protein